jgi:hypothetical protein
MVGLAVWAFLSQGTVAELPARQAGGLELELEEWNEGTMAVVLVLACQPRDARRLGRALLKRLGATHDDIYYEVRASKGEGATKLRHFRVRRAPAHSEPKPS